MAENDEKSLTKGEHTRAVLIEAAFDLFLTNGYHGTSMRQIAEKGGLAVGGIYNHFASKEEIFAAVLEVYHPLKRVIPRLNEARGDTIEEFVTDAAHRILSEVQGTTGRAIPLALVELVEFQGQHMALILEKVLPNLLMFVQRFSERRGKLRRLPLPLLLRMFIVTVVGYVITELVLQRTAMFKEMEVGWFDGMIDIYLHGILEAEA